MSTKSPSSAKSVKKRKREFDRNLDSTVSQQDKQHAAQIKQLAFASLILSSLSMFLSFFGCIPGIVCGHIVRTACKKNPHLAGSGLGLAGLVIGYAMLIANVILLIYLLIALRSYEQPVDPFIYMDS